ncbi:MAG: hypothetical protein RIQ47_349 [Bacteroidota bacterium]|jgi:ubiquinone/menaquinone biosynthesis C-methylase UbiE
MSGDFHEKSYSRHQHSYHNLVVDSPELYRDWFLKDNADFWRHRRKLNFILPFLEQDPAKTWLCIGDGRYGTSAMYIDAKGGIATATDITDQLLQKSFEAGLIKRMAIQNAEAISYDDNSFDYVFCKEAYHHFPRPFVGMYEMLRVARKAVLLIEPRDSALLPLPLKWFRQFKNSIKKVIGKTVYAPDHFNYEEVGNYVYAMAEREFEKLALGMNLPVVAFKAFDDVYYPGVEQERASTDFPLFRKMQWELKLLSLKRVLGFHSSNYLVTVVFKQAPDNELIVRLQQLGYQVRNLPRNPYA